MLDRKLIAVVVLLGVSAIIFWASRRKDDPQAAVQDIAYSVVCLNCKHQGQLTTHEMNHLIRSGAVVSPAKQTRRFYCRDCGQTNLVSLSTLPHDQAQSLKQAPAE